MSRFFDELEAQLHAAAVAHAAGRRAASRRSFPRLRLGVRLAPVLAAALVAFAVAAVVLTTLGSGGGRSVGSAGGGGHPGPASSPPHLSARENKYVNEVLHATIRRDPACAPHGGFLQRAGGVRAGRPSEALVAILGVLRRPRTAADKPPWSLIHLDLGGLYTHYIRLARVQAGVPYYVVVVRVPGSPRTPRRCLAEMRSVAERELPSTLSKSERKRILAFDVGVLRQGRNVPHKPYDSVLLVGRGAGGGGSASQIENGRTAIGVLGRTIAGIVPDGVAKVQLPLRPLHGYPSLTLTATVINNVFVARAPRFDLPTGVVWLSPTGAVIKRVDLNR